MQEAMRVWGRYLKTFKQKGGASTIPKKIWTYWNNDILPDIIKRCIETWRKHNPDFEIVAITPSNLKQYVDMDLKALKWNDSPSRESDIIRLLVIEKYGGIWSDASIIMTASVNKLLKDDKEFMGYYKETNTTDMNYPAIDSWFFGSVPNGGFIKKWKDALFTLGNYPTVQDAVNHYQNVEKVNMQNIGDTRYLFIHVAAQYVLQKQMTIDERKQRLHLEKAEDGPFKFASVNNWNHALGLDSLCRGENITDVIKFIKGDRERLEANKELQDCVFGKVEAMGKVKEEGGGVKERTIDLVIAYYKENLDWLKEYKDIQFHKVYIYNKGPNKAPEVHLNVPIIEIKLENIGRCDHTYLYHIIENYNNLADITIFSPGSTRLPHKKAQFDFVAKKTNETKQTVFKGVYYNNVVKDNYDFQLEKWRSSNKNNNDGDEKSKLALANIRPFGKWYENHFSNIHIHMINYFAIFSVSKEHIKHHSLEYYKQLIKEFPNHSNPEVGHYFERAWVAVFDPIPKECLYYG
jgi:hypothetical protein